jgi:hypothetical protein
MHLSLVADRSTRPPGSLLGETLVGTSLVLLGVWLVCIALTTRVVAVLAATVGPGAAGPAIGLLAWTAMLAAPAGLVLLGTDRLARMLATVRAGIGRRRPDSLATLPHDVAVIRGVRLDDGRPTPTLLVGGFGVAVVHGVPGAGTRRNDQRVERAGLDPVDPRDPVTRDAERLRRWLGQREVDFVVRVYAAMIASDDTLTRSAACAVVTAEQLTAWIGSLPRQRSLTMERRTRLVSLLRDAT